MCRIMGTRELEKCSGGRDAKAAGKLAGVPSLMHEAATQTIVKAGDRLGYVRSHRQMTLPSASRLLSKTVESVTRLHMTAASTMIRAVHSAKGSRTLTVSHRLHGRCRH